MYLISILKRLKRSLLCVVRFWVVEEPMEADRPASRQGVVGEGGDGVTVKAWPPASLALDNPDGW